MHDLRLTQVAHFEFSRSGQIEAEQTVLKLGEQGLHARIGRIRVAGSPTKFVVEVPALERERARRVLGVEFETGRVS